MRFGENNRRAFLSSAVSGLSAWLLGSQLNQTTTSRSVRVNRDAIQRAQQADIKTSTVVKIAANGTEFNSKGEEVTEADVAKVQERSDRRKEIDENVGLLEARQNESDHTLEQCQQEERMQRRFAAMGGLGVAGLNALLPSSDGEIKESINEVDKLYLALGKISSGKATKEDLVTLLPYVTSVTDTRDRWDENFPEEYLKILELELDFSSLKNSTVSKLAPITIEIASNRDQKIIFGNSASASNNKALPKEELNTILRNLTKISDQDKELIKKIFQIHDPGSDPVADLSTIGGNIEKHSNSEITPPEKYNAPTPTVKSDKEDSVDDDSWDKDLVLFDSDDSIPKPAIKDFEDAMNPIYLNNFTVETALNEIASRVGSITRKDYFLAFGKNDLTKCLEHFMGLLNSFSVQVSLETISQVAENEDLQKTWKQLYECQIYERQNENKALNAATTLWGKLRDTIPTIRRQHN